MLVKNTPLLHRPAGTNDIHSRHFITLGDAINGTTIPIHTVAETIKLDIAPGSLFNNSMEQKVFEGCGIDENGVHGKHVAEVSVLLPQNLDRENIRLFERAV